METQRKTEDSLLSKLALGFLIAIVVLLLFAGTLRLIEWAVVFFTIGYTAIVLALEIIGNVVRAGLMGRKKNFISNLVGIAMILALVALAAIVFYQLTRSAPTISPEEKSFQEFLIFLASFMGLDVTDRLAQDYLTWRTRQMRK